MIFVLEQYLKRREAAIRAWKDDGNKWVREKNSNSDYHHYGFDDWESGHPCPVIDFAAVVRVVTIAVVAVSLVTVVALFIFSHEPSKKDSKPKATTSQVQEKRGEYKVGDTVQVVYGTYKDSVGVVIRDGEEGAIIKLTESSYTKEMAAANNSSGGLDKGSLLTIGSRDNLVPYKEVK